MHSFAIVTTSRPCFQSSGDCPRCVRRLKRDAARAHQVDDEEKTPEREPSANPFDSPEKEENSGKNPFDSPENKSNGNKNPFDSPEGSNSFNTADNNAYDPQLNPFE